MKVQMGAGVCTLCGGPVQRKELSLRYEGQIYHLLCYRSPVSSLTYASQLSTSQKAEVSAWLQRRTVQTTLCSVSSPVRRALLVIFSYLTIGETERAARVNHTFCYTSRDDELWQYRYIALYAPKSTQSCAYRALFQDRREHTCWHCQTLLHKQINMHPNTHTPLCQLCAASRSCRLLSVDTYCQARQIDRSVVDTLLIPSFKLGKKDYGYLCQLAPVFLVYAEKRQNLLCLLLQQRGNAAEELNYVREANLKEYYSALEDTGYGYECLFWFLGRDERKERLEQIVEKYLATHREGFI